MQKICLIRTSVDASDAANMLASGLINAHLAACVQISDPGLSIYRWQGSVEQANEYYLCIKTTPARRSAVIDWLSQHHPYELAEITWSEDYATDAYAAWVQANVQPDEDGNTAS